MHLSARAGRFAVFLLVSAFAASAQEIRFANGAPLKGEPTGTNKDGLEVKLGSATKTYPWDVLAPGTRYRYEVSYRANADQIVAGVSSANWSNEPDSVYKPFAPAADNKSAKTDTVAVVATDNGLALTLNGYEDVPAMTPIDIPKLEIRAMELAQFWSIQYGPTRKDVAVLVFDTKGASDMYDTMFTYTVADGRTDKLRGAKRTDKADNFMDFRKIPLQSQFGNTKASFELECWFATKMPGVQVRANVELESGATKASCMLRGTPAGVAQGNGQILTRELLSPPTLWFVLDTSSGKPLLVGNIRMGKLKLIPGHGMDNKVKLTIMNSVNGIAMEQEVSVGGGDQEAKYMIVIDLSKLAQNETYTVKASADLGTFLGQATFEDKITVPKFDKK